MRFKKKTPSYAGLTRVFIFTALRQKRWMAGSSPAMMIIVVALSVLGILTTSVPARADLKIFACEPEWGALAQELGGEHISVYVATTAQQDPHHIEARPSLIARARAADMVVCTGAELEVGWLPAVQRQSANPKIQPGAPGDFEAAGFVRMLDVPGRLDRADGDVHAAGNPHVQTDARNIAKIAQGLATRFVLLDAANGAYYEARHKTFDDKWRAALARWDAAAQPLRGRPIAVQHPNWAYLNDWLGLKQVVSLEPKPGVPPSAGYLSEVVARVRGNPVAMVIRAPHESARPSEFLAAQANVPAVLLPFTIGGTPGATDLYSLFDDTIARLLAAASIK
jgi:zinc/manganese transport system substrate-binding protein